MNKTHTIAIRADPHDPDDFDVTEEALEQALDARRKRGRPAGSNKESVTMRLDKDVLEGFRATGPGWQSRINETLKKALEEV